MQGVCDRTRSGGRRLLAPGKRESALTASVSGGGGLSVQTIHFPVPVCPPLGYPDERPKTVV